MLLRPEAEAREPVQLHSLLRRSGSRQRCDCQRRGNHSLRAPGIARTQAGESRSRSSASSQARRRRGGTSFSTIIVSFLPFAQIFHEFARRRVALERRHRRRRRTLRDRSQRLGDERRSAGEFRLVDVECVRATRIARLGRQLQAQLRRLAERFALALGSHGGVHENNGATLPRLSN